MSSTATRIANRVWEPFYYLKVTGLPYYFFAGTNPYSSKYGGKAWSAPYAGATPLLCMDMPNGTLEQRLNDIVGCLATAQRIRLKLFDFETADSLGHYSFFSRLFAEGRVLADASLAVAQLSQDVLASEVTDLWAIGGKGASFTAGPADLYVGNETVGYTTYANPSTGLHHFSTLSRMKYPCHPSFPPIPYYRVVQDPTGQAAVGNLAIPVANQPITMVGRTCCLYAGHLDDDGNPAAESDSLALMVGRIIGIEAEAPAYTIEVESIMADLTRAKIAPGLARGYIQSQIVLNDPQWTSFIIAEEYGKQSDGTPRFLEDVVSITPGTYTSPEHLMVAIAAAMTATFRGRKTIGFVTAADGTTRIAFSSIAQFNATENLGFYVRHGQASVVGQPFATGTASLLSALGFPPGTQKFESSDPSTFSGAANAGNMQTVVAPDPPASVFIPTVVISDTVFSLTGDDMPARRFFTDQGTDSHKAYVRFGDSQIVRLKDKSSSAGPPLVQTLTTTSRVPALYGVPDNFDRPYYYVPSGSTGIVEQVIVSAESDGLKLIGTFLCSNWDGSTDGEFDIYPEGVGLGWNSIVDKPALRVGLDFVADRLTVVDKDTAFMDLFKPISMESGIFCVWSQADGLITFRQIGIPIASAASNFQFIEDNRPKENLLSKVTRDPTHVRTGWTIKWGWDFIGQKLAGAPVGYTDEFAIAIFAADAKHVDIEDKTIPIAPGGVVALAPIQALANIAKRSVYYRYPWMRLDRGANKTAMLLAPGTFHAIADNTIHNPFSGVFGIQLSDGVYGFLTRVAIRLPECEVDCTLLLNGLMPLQNRPWSPTARIDFSANAGGFTNGYNSGTKQIKFVRHYTGNPDASTYDGIDFQVGDKVIFITRDNDGAVTSSDSGTISAVATDGLTVTLVAALVGPLDTSTETIMLFDLYTSATTSQQGRVSWMGDAVDGLILGTALNTKWA